MKEKLLGILVCPYCKGKLQIDVKERSNSEITEGSLYCRTCGKTYIVSNGIIDFLGDSSIFEEKNVGSKRKIEWRYDEETWDIIDGSLNANYDNFQKKCEGSAFILDWGGGTGGRLKKFKETNPEKVIINLDPSLFSLKETPESIEKIRAIGQHLPFRDNSIAGVHARAAFHHVPQEIEICMEEIWRVLVDGGLLFTLEPLENNPISRLARTLVTTDVHDTEEKPLDADDLLKTISRYFEIDYIKYHYLFSYLMPHIVARIPLKNTMRKLSAFLLEVDDSLLESWPRTRRYAGFIEMLATKKAL